MPINYTSIRPVTSKARGICKYYTTPRGCFAGESCKFLHEQPEGETKEGEQPLLTPYDRSKKCKYFDQGFCKRGENCWFLHKSDRPKDVQGEEECSICYEKPTIYGLLGGCSHIFCITCIRRWRDPQKKSGDVVESGNTKKCPMCRAPSRFITPSSNFWKDGTEEKKNITEAYMESMARVPCRYFQKSLAKNPGKPTCPYGKDCFYRHFKEDGTPFVFEDGVDVCMRKYGGANRRDIGFDFLPMDIRLAADGSLDFLNLYDIGGGTINTQGHADSTMAPIPSTSGLHRVHTDATPSIHRHHRERIYNWDGIAITVRRLREVGRSLEILNDGLAVETPSANLEGEGEPDWVESVQQGHLSGRDGDEMQEDEVMERLESLADHVLASVALQPGAGEGETSATDPESWQAQRDSTSDDDPLPRLIHYLSVSDDDDDESGGDMPALESVSSYADGSEDEDTDVDVDEDETLAVDVSDDIASASVSASLPEEQPLLLDTAERLEDNASAASPVQVDGGGSIGRSDVEVAVQQVSQGDTPASVTQTTAGNVTSPTTRGVKNGRPSDAFTTDGRGRVISVGDTPLVVPPHSQSAPDDEIQPESFATSPINSEVERVERRGILGWIGSLI